MRIGCFDKSAATRLELQQFVERAFADARAVVGHLRGLEIVPATLAELCLPTHFDAAVFGPALSADERFLSSKKLSDANRELPIFMLFSEGDYSFRNLRRFEKCTAELFSLDEPTLRFVHRLCLVGERRDETQRGPLITLSGVKGGVGTTSLTVGLAHAAQSLGKRAVILDLTPNNALPIYLYSARSSSPDYAALLLNHLPADRSFVEKCITEAPNGITFHLQPSGGAEIRALWLNDSERVEHTLAIIDHLTKMFDVVLADLGTVESLLTTTLFAHATRRILVSSTEPVAAHLLGRRVLELSAVLNGSRGCVALTETSPGALAPRDVEDLIRASGISEADLMPIVPIPFDRHGRFWVGSGNTFYTESSRATQERLDRLLDGVLKNTIAGESFERAGADRLARATERFFPKLSSLSLGGLGFGNRGFAPRKEPVKPVLTNRSQSLSLALSAPVGGSESGESTSTELKPKQWFGEPEVLSDTQGADTPLSKQIGSSR